MGIALGDYMNLPRIMLCALALIGIQGCVTAADSDGEAVTQPVESISQLSCTSELDESNHHTATLSVNNKTLTIDQAAINARFAQLSYSLSPVALQVAPIDEPNFECETGSPVIIVWDEYVRVETAYFKLTPMNAGHAKPQTPMVETSKNN